MLGVKLIITQAICGMKLPTFGTESLLCVRVL